MDIQWNGVETVQLTDVVVNPIVMAPVAVMLYKFKHRGNGNKCLVRDVIQPD